MAHSLLTNEGFLLDLHRRVGESGRRGHLLHMKLSDCLLAIEDISNEMNWYFLLRSDPQQFYELSRKAKLVRKEKYQLIDEQNMDTEWYTYIMMMASMCVFSDDHAFIPNTDIFDSIEKPLGEAPLRALSILDNIKQFRDASNRFTMYLHNQMSIKKQELKSIMDKKRIIEDAWSREEDIYVQLSDTLKGLSKLKWVSTQAEEEPWVHWANHMAQEMIWVT